MKALVDRDVIIDALAHREPWNGDAEGIFEYAAMHPGNLFVTANVLIGVFGLMESRMEDRHAIQACQGKLLELFGVVGICQEDCVDAFRTGACGFREGTMLAAAMRNGIPGIITRDTVAYLKGTVDTDGHTVAGRVEVMAPQTFLYRASGSNE